LALNRRNISGELYLMLLVTCSVQPLIAISQNRIATKYIKQNETENQYQILSNFKYYHLPFLSFFFLSEIAREVIN